MAETSAASYVSTYNTTPLDISTCMMCISLALAILKANKERVARQIIISYFWVRIALTKIDKNMFSSKRFDALGFPHPNFDNIESASLFHQPTSVLHIHHL